MESLYDNYKTIMAIDPGATGAAAVHQKGNNRAHKVDNDMERFELLIDLYNDGMQGFLVFIEDVKMWNSDNGFKKHAISKLILNADRMKQIMIRKKVPFIEVSPRTWQTGLRIHQKGEEYADRKERFYQIANKRFHSSKVLKYNADAYLILQFGLMKLQTDPDWVEEKLPENELKLF